MQSPNALIDAVGLATMVVRPGDTAVAMGIGDLPVASNSHYLHLMESAAIGALAEHLDSGETSRLLSIDLEVMAAVSIGVEIRAIANCVEVDGKNVRFNCDIYDGERHVATAQMKRVVVERVSFLARTAAQTLTAQAPIN